MILPLFRRASDAGTISALYGMIVAQARLPIFYRTYGVPDTIDGRFEMIVLHLFLLLRRLDGGAGEARLLGQQVFDQFCRDMDQNLREIGIGDLKVPLEMRRIGEAYYGRARAYEAGLDDLGALAQTLARNVFGTGATEPAAATRFATYVKQVAERLETQDIAALARGVLSFPEP